MVRYYDLEGLFQPKQFYVSMFFSNYSVQLLQLCVSHDFTQTMWPLNFTAYSIF